MEELRIMVSIYFLLLANALISMGTAKLQSKYAADSQSGFRFHICSLDCQYWQLETKTTEF
jgi:hypothetical protein